MAFCPFAAQWPGPVNKQGYAAYPSPQRKEGWVVHSMVGTLSGAVNRLFGPDQASWQFSIDKDGRIYQHYDSEAVCWHCGVVGDVDPLSAAVGNVALIGVEMEGGPIGNVSEVWTEAQYASLLRLLRWGYETHLTLKPPILRQGLWEHNWLSVTSCPSGRNQWNRLIIDMEDEMLDEIKDFVPFLRMLGRAFHGEGGFLVHMPKAQADGTPLPGQTPVKAFEIIGGDLTQLYAADASRQERIQALEDEIAALKAAGGGTGLKRGDQVTLE